MIFIITSFDTNIKSAISQGQKYMSYFSSNINISLDIILRLNSLAVYELGPVLELAMYISVSKYYYKFNAR